MQVLILAPQWGQEKLPFEDFLIKIKNAGFNGVDTWLPEEFTARKNFIGLLKQYKLPLVAHQHQANGRNINEFCRSFEYYLNVCLESEPLLINSHSGRDYFTLDEQLRVIDTAQEFSVRHNIQVLHETHRGRLCFSPYNARELFTLRPEMRLTADLSHWVCVTESYLENCEEILTETIYRTFHVHARVGHTQGPQVPDPRVEEWQQATNKFVEWWLQIIDARKLAGEKFLTITPEFGPPPYMTTLPASGEPLADQFALNCYIKDLIKTSISASV